MSIADACGVVAVEEPWAPAGALVESHITGDGASNTPIPADVLAISTPLSGSCVTDNPGADNGNANSASRGSLAASAVLTTTVCANPSASARNCKSTSAPSTPS